MDSLNEAYDPSVFHSQIEYLILSRRTRDAEVLYNKLLREDVDFAMFAGLLARYPGALEAEAVSFLLKVLNECEEPDCTEGVALCFISKAVDWDRQKAADAAWSVCGSGVSNDYKESLLNKAIHDEKSLETVQWVIDVVKPSSVLDPSFYYWLAWGFIISSASCEKIKWALERDTSGRSVWTGAYKELAPKLWKSLRYAADFEVIDYITTWFGIGRARFQGFLYEKNSGPLQMNVEDRYGVPSNYCGYPLLAWAESRLGLTPEIVITSEISAAFWMLQTAFEDYKAEKLRYIGRAYDLKSLVDWVQEDPARGDVDYLFNRARREMSGQDIKWLSEVTGIDIKKAFGGFYIEDFD